MGKGIPRAERGHAETHPYLQSICKLLLCTELILLFAFLSHRLRLLFRIVD